MDASEMYERQMEERQLREHRQRQEQLEEAEMLMQRMNEVVGETGLTFTEMGAQLHEVFTPEIAKATMDYIDAEWDKIYQENADYDNATE